MGAVRRGSRCGRLRVQGTGRPLGRRCTGSRGEGVPMKTKRLGFLGAGNMSGALIKGLLHGGISPGRIMASDVKAERLEQLRTQHGIRTTADNHELLRESDVLVLAVKPQVVDR